MKSSIEISADRLRANFAAVGVAAPGAEVLCVLKADAYGHGAGICAPVLVEAGARWLGVADLEEAVAVRAALASDSLKQNVRVVVMCGFAPGDARWLIEGGFRPVIWTREHVEALGKAAEQLDRRVAVHLEVDSGMARQGVAPGAELDAVLDAVGRHPAVRLEGVFSHLCCAEMAGSDVTEMQKRRFTQALEQTRSHAGVGAVEFAHFDNSSAVDGGATLDWLKARAAESGMRPLVRPGLALYGYTLPLNGASGLLSPHLRPVARWTTRISGVREVEAGTTVGYGATFRATGPMRLALLPVGYADGFRREASSGMGDGWVMIAGRCAPVVGRVSMNLTVVDATGHEPAPSVGDEAVLLGEGVTAHDHARWAGTIPYEILCGMRGHRRLSEETVEGRQ